MLPTKFQVNWLFGSGRDAKRFWLFLAIFDLQVTPMLPTKFQVIWPFSSGGEAKNRFSRWGPSWISNRKDFSYF